VQTVFAPSTFVRYVVPGHVQFHQPSTGLERLSQGDGTSIIYVVTGQTQFHHIFDDSDSATIVSDAVLTQPQSLWSE